MSEYFELIKMILIWSFGWGIYFYSTRKKNSLALKPELSFVYFLTLIFLSFFLLKNNLPPYITNYLPQYFSTILIVFFLINYFYFLLHKNYKEPIVSIEDEVANRWMTANRQAIFITSAHIVFQQIIVTALIILLQNKFNDLSSIILYFGILFGLGHVPLVFFKGWKFMLLYTIPSTLSALIFPVIMIKLSPIGFILNYIIHWSFYAMITYIFWHHQGKINEKSN